MSDIETTAHRTLNSFENLFLPFDHPGLKTPKVRLAQLRPEATKQRPQSGCRLRFYPVWIYLMLLTWAVNLKTPLFLLGPHVPLF